MDDLYRELHTLLTKQLDTARGLCAAVEKQIEAMRRNDLDGLHHALQEVVSGGGELERLETARLEVQARLEELAGTGPGVGLRDLLPRAPEELRQPLATIRGGLYDVLRDLREAGGIAQLMSARGMQFSTALLRLLGVGADQEQTYNPDGRVHGSGPAGGLDRSV